MYIEVATSKGSIFEGRVPTCASTICMERRYMIQVIEMVPNESTDKRFVKYLEVVLQLLIFGCDLGHRLGYISPLDCELRRSYVFGTPVALKTPKNPVHL